MARRAHCWTVTISPTVRTLAAPSGAGVEAESTPVRLGWGTQGSRLVELWCRLVEPDASDCLISIGAGNVGGAEGVADAGHAVRLTAGVTLHITEMNDAPLISALLVDTGYAEATLTGVAVVEERGYDRR